MSSCGKCNRVYSTLKAFQRHVRENHKNSRFLCSCGSSFSRKRTLKQHSLNCEDNKFKATSSRGDLSKSEFDTINECLPGKGLLFSRKLTVNSKNESDSDNKNHGEQSEDEQVLELSNGTSENDSIVKSEGSNSEYRCESEGVNSVSRSESEAEEIQIESESESGDVATDDGDSEICKDDTGCDDCREIGSDNSSSSDVCSCDECWREDISDNKKHIYNTSKNKDGNDYFYHNEKLTPNIKDMNRINITPHCPYRQYYTNQAKVGDVINILGRGMGSKISALGRMSRPISLLNAD